MKLVILESYALREGDLDWSGLAALADEVDYYPRTPYDQIAARVGDAELVIVNKCCIDGPVLDACPNLRWVGVTATGTDSLDVEACRRRGVAVCNVPGYSTPSVAQLAVTLLLAGCQRLRDYDQSVRAGRWQLDLPAELSARPGLELAGKTLGIVGYGAIGRQVARVAAALDMQVLVHTRTTRPDADGVRFVSLETLLAESHAISLHCPATDATRHIIRRETLALCRPGVVLVNTARGALVDHAALLEALDSGRVAFYGSDVADVEPPAADSPLRRHPSVLLTPHMGWTSPESLARLTAIMEANLRSFLAGKPENLVNGPLCL